MSALKTYFKTVSPPYKNRDFLTLFASLFILIAIPVTVYVVINVREPASKAEVGGAIRGAQGDLWADVIIGKRDFTEITPGLANPQRAASPGGAVVDVDTAGSTLGRLYVWSGLESRIIGIDLDTCENLVTECTATKVIGQPNITDYGACNRDSSFQFYPTRAPATASSLCGVREAGLSIAENLSHNGFFTKGGNLYVPDYENHRVLVYYDAWNGNTVADEVIGQDDYTGVLCNKTTTPYSASTPTASSLCLFDPDDTAQSGAGVALDLAGNLWVADNGNNRVVRFPKQGTVFSKTADVVIGQTNFTTGPSSDGTALNKLKNPNTLRFDPNGNLFVGDTGNHRIMKYAPAQQITNGSGTIFASFQSQIFVGEADTINDGLWVNILNPISVKLYDFNSGAVKKSLDFSQRSAGSIGVDKQGNIVVASYSQGTLLFKNPLAKTNSNWDKNFFLSGFANNSRLNQVHGVAIAGNQLFVSDLCRIMVWNDPVSLTTGKAADFVLLQSNFTTYNCAAANLVGAMKADSANRVYVKNHDKILIYQAPVTSSSVPIKTISNPVPAISGGSYNILTDYEGLFGLTPQTIGGQLYLWVTDRNNNRVLRLKDPLGNPQIDVVIGQTNLTDNTCNRGLAIGNNEEAPMNYVCLPGLLSIDKQNNLYISDHSLETDGNKRLLMFASATLPAGNSTLVANISATKSFPKTGPTLHATWEPAFDSQNRMVVGYNAYGGSRFLGYYNNPTGSSTQPDGFFKDFNSMSFGATFDGQDNLYATDINRSRVLIYKKPFGTATKPGDYDSNGSVGVGDLNILVNTWKSTTDLRADGNGNGAIDLGDLSILVNNWGT